MSEFKTITTQEEFDNAIKERLDRQAKKTADEVRKGFAGWLSPDDAKKATADLEKQIADLTGKLNDSKAAYDKLDGEKKALDLARLKESAARDAGLPFELASRLSGETADELKADAESLSKLVNSGNNSYVAPLFETPAKTAASVSDAAYMSMLGELTN